MDSERPLSPRGERDALEAARHMKDAGFIPDRIISSPFLRARRTAEIAAGIFPSAGRETAAELSDGPASAIVELIQGLAAGRGRVLVVGHQPLMGAIAGYFSGRDGFDLSPAGFVRVLELNGEGHGKLAEFYSPPHRNR